MRYGYVQLCTWTFYFLSLAAQVRRARARRHTCASWAGYAGYTWQQTKLNDWTAAYGSLGTY